MASQIQFHQNLSALDPKEWNALVDPAQPFFEYEFLRALEESGCVGFKTAWHPRYLTLTQDGCLAGAIPFYVKYDSYGEFIFDWQWAGAYARSGIPYYPKGVVAVPFTPANGQRILVHPDASFEACAEEMVEALILQAQAEDLSSIHFLYLKKEEHDFLLKKGFLSRLSYQYHWENRGYGAFEDFLGDLHHKRRNQIHKERKKVAEEGVEILKLEGEAIEPEHLEVMWRFSANTFGQKSGERPYLNPEFFGEIYRTLRHRTLLVLARKEGEWVAGSLNFKKGDHLFGRYWGESRHIPYLHFECCFYQLIDYAIENKIQKVEAGAQGEQKFLRGFATRPTYSCHWIAHPVFKEAIGRFLEDEKAVVEKVIEDYHRISPLKYLRSL
ncbi:MAG: GNAT family N-acetyltransferase [bacterium]